MHKGSATIEIIDDRETVLAGGRFGTDRDGYRAMLAAGRRHPERIWAPTTTRHFCLLDVTDRVQRGGQRYFELGSPLWSHSASR